MEDVQSGGPIRVRVRLRAERGRLAAAEAWPRAPFRAADACFPDLTFLQLLMGYRSLDELADVSPDCRVPQPEARLVLNALFPKQASAVWPIA